MKTKSILSDVTIQVSSRPVLTMPRSLVKQLGVRKGERVSVQVRNGTLRIHKNGLRKPPIRSRSRTKPRARRTGSVLNSIGYIKSKSDKIIDIDKMFSHHGYEEYERPPREGS